MHAGNRSVPRLSMRRLPRHAVRYSRERMNVDAERTVEPATSAEARSSAEAESSGEPDSTVEPASYAGAESSVEAERSTNAEKAADQREGGGGVKMLLPLVVIIVILAGLTLLLTGGKSKPALPGNAATAKSVAFDGNELEPPQLAPELGTLHNYDGSSFNLASQRGKAVFVTFLYAHCPDVCPIIASNLHNTYALMPPATQRQVSIVAVSVDPHGDTPGTVAAFVKQHELTGQARYLIGSASQLGRVWEAWRVGSQRDASNPALVNHSALIYGIGANGKIYTIYASNFQPREIIHDVPALLSRTG
jgi:protein SCO1